MATYCRYKCTEDLLLLSILLLPTGAQKSCLAYLRSSALRLHRTEIQRPSLTPTPSILLLHLDWEEKQMLRFLTLTQSYILTARLLPEKITRYVSQG